MNFTLNQLRVFQKVVQTLSITKAAEELHLTQPAVSIQLKNFQDQLELPLYEILNKKIYITDFGKEIAELANKIIEDVHSIQFKNNAHLGQLTGQLKVSVVSTGKYIAPYFLADFIQLHQGVELMLDVTNKSKVIESLEKNEVDLALVSVLPDNLRIEKLELLNNKLFLVGNSSTNKTAKIYDKKIFDDLPLIYREKGSGTRHVMEKYLIKNNIYIKKKMELTSNEAVKQAVLAGLGYSIMPLIGIKTELDVNLLKIIPVKGFPIQSKWSLIWLKDKKLSAAAQAYIEYIKNEKLNIIDSKFGWCDQYN
jgi:DNA-binding transcriptional LysR family regulator